MFGFYISLPFLLFALYRLIVVLYNFLTRPFLPIGTPTDNQLVSILVYVKNSEKTIGNLIQGLINQTYSNLEILIYNDHSSDRTVDVISEFSAGDNRVRLFNGNEVSSGLQIKNYAFDRLSQKAKGRYYLFVTSEFDLDNQFIANAISHMQCKTLSLLTIYPKPQSQNFWVRTQISVIQWMFLSLVFAKSYLGKRDIEGSIIGNPLQLIESTAYQLNRWYEKFKDDEAPEAKIVEAIDSLSLKSDSLLGDNRVTYEVVDSFSEGTDHLSVSLAKFFKNRNWLIAYSIAITFGLVMAIFLLPFPLVFLYLLAVIYSRMLIALLTQHSILGSLMLLPVQYFTLMPALVKVIKKPSKISHDPISKS